jgi:CAAX prenyl protease-like protein
MSLRTPSPAFAPLAWGALALGSALPLILWQELSGAPAPLWLLLAQAGALLALIFAPRRLPALEQLEGFVLWLLALAVGWHLVLGGVFAVPAWQEWQRGVPWVVRGAVVQVLVFVPTLLLVLFGVGRRSRRELRLAWGDGGASASPDPYTLWRRPAWRRLGSLWAVLISVGTLTAMLFAIPPEAGMLARLLPVLPVVLLLAAANTFNEEFQFRNVPLATLPALLGKAQALLLTGVYFGLEHYYGNPPAFSGVLLATFLGYLLGKSMLETGGSRWTW